MTAEEIEALFTRADGAFVFARWGRPVSPVVFGVADETLPVLKGALQAVLTLAGHTMAETDPELGSNLMVFFCTDWDEIAAIPNLDRLIPNLGPLMERLKAADANQYRIFRFDAEGAIKAAFVFVRMDAHLNSVPAETLALGQAVQGILLWSDRAFMEASPMALLPDGRAVLRPEIGDLIRAAYDPVLPGASKDSSFALRLAARMNRGH